MKRVIKLIVTMLLISLVLSSCLLDDRASKSSIISFVNENMDLIMESIESGDFSELEGNGIIRKVDTQTNHCIDFSCGGYGLGSGTGYRGFFYSANNDMYAIWCAPSFAVLDPKGDGYYWKERDGDNKFYVEKICEYFFYYEADF